MIHDQLLFNVSSEIDTFPKRQRILLEFEGSIFFFASQNYFLVWNVVIEILYYFVKVRRAHTKSQRTYSVLRNSPLLCFSYLETIGNQLALAMNLYNYDEKKLSSFKRVNRRERGQADTKRKGLYTIRGCIDLITIKSSQQLTGIPRFSGMYQKQNKQTNKGKLTDS